jgi:hypothetical protein
MIPTSLLIGSSVVSGIFGAFGQRSQRKAAERYAKAVHKASLQDAALQMSQLGVASEQTMLQSSQQMRNINRQGALESGQVRAGSGAAGVSGAGIDTLEREFERQALTRLAAQQADTQIRLGNIRGQQQAVGAQAASRINQAYSQVPAKQSLLGSLLKIGGDALMVGATFGGGKA